ncbi:MAG TPA: hypothetical protein VFL47_04875, partial [Flavisolibacter sp.]|nr:hypothetical protein [Flavisolibacter sp.]
MRKWFVLLLVFLVACFCAIYFFIPNTITVKKETRLGVNANAFTREFLHEGTGHLLTAEKTNDGSQESRFEYNGNLFTPVEKKFTSLLYTVQKKQDSMLAELVVIPYRTDTVALSFVGVTKAGINPFHRLQKMLWAKKVASDFESLMTGLQSHYGDTTSIYGYRIRKSLVTDTAFISTSTVLKTYPDNATIYAIVDKLKAFAQKNKAQVTGAPMLNVTVTTDSSYLTRVALPLNKRLPTEGDIEHKWMMNQGNILIAEVRGGPAQINKALAAVKTFVHDHGLATVAIPFQSMVTDRRAEKDTSKW